MSVMGGSISRPTFLGGGGTSSGSGGGVFLGNIAGPTGASIVQLEKGGPFQINQPTALPTKKTSSSTGNTTKNYNENTTAKKTGNNQTNTNTKQVTDRFDPASRAAFTNLLAQLMGGGTASQRQGMSELQALLGRSMADEEEYSIDAARAQAQESLPSYARQLREGVMPTILGAQEGAGLSGDALTALLAQDQVTRVSEAANAAELAAIQAYADISQAQQGITGGAATSLANDPVQQSLQDLLGIGKGSYESVQTNETINQIINEIVNTTMSGTENTTQNLTEEEDTQYQSLGGLGGGGSGGGSNYAKAGGLIGSGGAGNNGMTGSESLATLLASLKPGQNLQDYSSSGFRNPGEGNMSFSQRGANTNALSALASRLGVRL